MKKITSLILLISILLSNALFTYTNATVLAWPDFNVKISSNTDATYTTNLSNIWIWTSLSFKNVSVLDNSSLNWTYNIHFPTGFTYNSYDASQNTCGFSLISVTNSNFKYSFSNISNTCESTIILNYTTNSTASVWVNNINILDENNSIVRDLNVNITSHNSITKAQTLDLNSDWYIDGYKLNLANSSNIWSLSWRQVDWVSVWSIYSSGSSYILPFTDGILSTWDLPQITGTFDTLSIWNNDINEEDSARPQIMKINSTVLSTLWTQSLNIWTWNLLFDISENLIPSSNQSFTLLKGTWTIAWNFSFLNDNLTKLYFVPSVALSAWTYTLSATSGAKDWSSNWNIIDVSIPSLIVSDSTAPNWITIWSNTWISINDWAALTNNNYVQLTLAALDNIWVSQMWISNDSGFSSGSWETYNTSKLNWYLWTGAGTKTVYIKFKDEAWNTSTTYNDSIEYWPTNNYINFDNIDSIYTNSWTINLSWGCNYISNTWAILSSTLVWYVNWVSIWNISCSSQRWSQSFNLTDNTTNIIRLEYDINSSLNNTINIIRPIPTCSTPANATLVSGTTYPTCDFTCNTWYTKQWWACITKSTVVTTAISNTHTYSFTPFTLYYSSPIQKTSLGLNLSNGIYTLTTTFTLSSDWTSVSLSNSSENLVSCNSWYQVSWNSCVLIPSSWGGGGWWGGATPTCTNSQIECSLYNNSYIWTRKSGVSCSWWNLWLACTPTNTTNTGTTNTWTINTSTWTIINTNTDTTNTNTWTSWWQTSTWTQTINEEIITIIKTDWTKVYFKDISNNFAKNYIIALASSGIVNGYSDNTFRPGNNTSRIEFLKMLLKWLGKDYSSYIWKKNPFWDVPDNSWQSPIVAKALALGIISQNRYFYPDKTISREEAMKMLIKTSLINLLTVENSSFSDSNWWAKNYIETAYKAWIISWQNIWWKLIFRPQDNITRAEVTKIIVKIISLSWNQTIKQNITTEVNTVINKVKDAYTLTKELKFWDYGTEVWYLQDIMKHFKYFDYDSTKYFWTITKTAYIKFALDKLWLTSVDWTVTKDAISKIMELNW